MQSPVSDAKKKQILDRSHTCSPRSVPLKKEANIGQVLHVQSPVSAAKKKQILDMSHTCSFRSVTLKKEANIGQVPHVQSPVSAAKKRTKYWTGPTRADTNIGQLPKIIYIFI